MAGVKRDHTYELETEIENLRQQLYEARETIEAIKNGEVDALIIQGKHGHELFTLKSADHTYRVFIEQMSEGALTIDSNGLIVYCNSSFAEILGSDSGLIVSNLFEKFVAANDREKYHALILLGWQADSKGEVNLTNGTRTIPVQLSIAALAMDEGKTLSVIVTDLSAQKEALRQQKIKNEQLGVMNVALELSNHDLQQFASVASHDLQEPLRKIQIFSHLLDEKFGNEMSDLQREYVSKIVASASRMKTLIVDVLNYSRLSSNENQFERTNLKDVIKELLDDLEMTIREKNATIIVNDLPVIEVNKGQMRQVFQNLLSNAIKFSRKGVVPVIEFWYRRELPEFPNPEKPNVPYYHIHVRDNGIGFDEKYSKSIFNLFEKLHSKDDYEGTGIGLAITRKIIDKHNGYINVTSTEGAGTEFVISLPEHQ